MSTEENMTGTPQPEDQPEAEQSDQQQEQDGAAQSEQPTAEEQTEGDQGQTEADQGQTEADQGQTEADQGQTGADQGQTEADQGQTEADQGQTEADQGQTEADQGQTEADQGQTEADQGQTEAGQGQTEVNQDQPEAQAEQGEAGVEQGETDGGQTQPEQRQTNEDQMEAEQGQEKAEPTEADQTAQEEQQASAAESKKTPSPEPNPQESPAYNELPVENTPGIGRARGAASPEDQVLGRSPAEPQNPQEPAEPELRSPDAPPVSARSPEPDYTSELDNRIPTPPPMPESRSQGTPSETESPNTLDLVWSFGMTRSVPVVNLTDNQRKMIAYACAHTGVLYDLTSNSQVLLQGHANTITATCVSADHRWFATADIGPDNMIIVWDSYTGHPVRTMFDPHPDGVVAMAMTPDARYLASISAGGIEDNQTMAIWDWTVEGETPLCTAELDPAYGLQNYVLFNPEDTTQIVTNSDHQVIFYSWKAGDIQYFAPPLTDDDFNKPVGKYSHSIFLSNSSRALTATSLGNLVVWDTNKPLTKVVKNEATPDKKALKLVKLQERGLNVLTTRDKYIVTGDVLGHVKFFDQSLKLVNWYQDFNLGPINSLTFAYLPEFEFRIPNKNEYPSDATIKANKFFIQDFVIGTTNAVFAQCATDGTNVRVIHRDHDAAVHGIDSHPFEPKLVVGSYSGLLKIWDYKKKQVEVSRTFERGQMIRCCVFDPQGEFIAVGFTNGSVRLLEARTLDDLLPQPFHYARDAITHMAFSHDSKFLATADAEFTTTVFVRDFTSNSPYAYLGRHRAHYKAINSVVFGKQLDGEAPTLITLGDDRHLVEYELDENNRDELRVASTERIEQSAIPLCMTWYPPITKESFLLTANDQFKIKLYNSTTKMCRKTLIGPTFGSPVQQMVVLPTEDPINDKRYLAYITEDKIGLQILPVDGNPHNCMAMNAHPQGVARLVSSHDGRYLFTAGGVDCTVHMWNINISALEAQALLGGEGLVPFYGLLEGGRDGELFKELEDYFYYAQIRSQGVDTMDSRETHTTIPVSEIPFVARSLGFYPSEQEIEDMKNEVKYSNYVDTGDYTTKIDLGDFIKLFINHRPAFGLQMNKLQWAFDTLGIEVPEGTIIDRGELLDILQNRGEHIKEYDLAEYLMTLLGHTDEGGSSEQHQFDTAQAGALIDQGLPVDISVDMFANDLLGFGFNTSDVLNVEDGTQPQMAA